jgi:hypothetical protein
MNIIKKSTLASALLIGLVVSASASANAASSNATVTWTGTVPGVTASDTVVITGLAGDLNALNGTITTSTSGVFESDAIILESHTNDIASGGTAATPVVGPLASANWTLISSGVTYDGIANPAQVVEVNINGAPIITGDVVSGTETITTTIKQTADLPEAEVGGSTVQANVIVMADVI